MNLTYQVSRDDYTALLADMIRRNDRRPYRIFTTLLLTVGQMVLIGWLCIFRLQSGQQRTFLAVWSILLAAVTAARFVTVRQRAKGTLQRLEYTGRLPEDFWKPHRLKLSQDTLQLQYGAQSLSCPLHGLTQVKVQNGALYLYCGNTMFDIIPCSAFENEAKMLAFAQSLKQQAAQSAPAEQESKTPDSPAVPDELNWHMDSAAFADGQYQAYRTMYYRYRFLRPATFVRLAVSAAAVVNLMHQLTPLNIGVSVLVLLLANLENISMIPAVCRLRIRRELDAWQGSTSFSLSLREDLLLYRSDSAAVQIPAHKIIFREAVGSYYILAWNQFPAVILPRETAESPAGSALLQRLTALYQDA